MTTRVITDEERITELQDELAAAQRTIDVLIARLERAGSLPHDLIEVGAQRAELGASILCLLYTSPSPRDRSLSRMPSSA